MGQYLPVVTMIVLAVLFGALSRLVSALLAPKAATPPKLAPYECGIIPARDTPERFPVRFYLVAMSFIVFDIEIIFLYPWAVLYRDLGVAGLVAITVFALPVVLSLVYEIAHGALDWGPSADHRPVGPIRSADRTAATTVRLVGLDGRPEVAA